MAGGRVSNYTSGQGLILMHEVLYTISGKRLPVVFHIGARALTSHSLNVHAGHDDVMSVSDSGWGILFGRTAQESGDLALIARRAAEDSRTPFFNVQDGFLTTHTVEDVLLCEPEMMKGYIGRPEDKLVNLFNPYNPIMTGVVQNQDSYMKGKIAQRDYYSTVGDSVQNAMDEFFRLTGRRYQMIDCYRMEDAEYAIVGMGCMIETAKATVDYIRREEGIKVGVVHITCYRPFPSKEIVEALRHLRAFTVLERMDDPIAPNNPVTNDIKAAFADAYTGSPGFAAIDDIPKIYSGSAGLGSRDVRPGHFVSIARNMEEEGPRFFVVGIKHDLALPLNGDPDVRPEGAFSMRGHSVGGYGSVTTNKVIATIAGDIFGKKVQAYPKYGSEKKGLPTTYYLTVADEPILTHCELKNVDFVPMNDINAFFTSQPLAGIQTGGTLFVQTNKSTPEDVWSNVPPKAKELIRDKKLRVGCGGRRQDRARGGAGSRPGSSYAGHCAAGDIPAGDAICPRRAPGRRRCNGTLGAGAAQVFRQPRREGCAGEYALRASRLRRGVRDSTGDHCAGHYGGGACPGRRDYALFVETSVNQTTDSRRPERRLL